MTKVEFTSNSDFKEYLQFLEDIGATVKKKKQQPRSSMTSPLYSVEYESDITFWTTERQKVEELDGEFSYEG